MYREVEGDLLKLASENHFDVIAHGCNCFCTMGAGIAVAMANTFGCNEFELERKDQRGNYNKLGTIDYRKFSTFDGKELQSPLTVINAYTQFHYGEASPNSAQPLDYNALVSCLRKINYYFAGKRIGLPQIGCGLAGGDWETVKEMIQDELIDCDVTVVIFKK